MRRERVSYETDEIVGDAGIPVLNAQELFPELIEHSSGIDLVLLERGLALKAFQLRRLDVAALLALDEDEVLAALVTMVTDCPWQNVRSRSTGGWQWSRPQTS